MQATYVHHPGRQIGTVLATSEGTSASTGDWAYYFQDAIGSTRGVWDDAGDRLGRYEYTPFGGKYADHGADITRKFTGHDWDSEARLYYTAYRYYSPDANRWLTRDPLGMVDGPNVYAYVVNNPISLFYQFGLRMTAAECEQEASRLKRELSANFLNTLTASVLVLTFLLIIATLVTAALYLVIPAAILAGLTLGIGIVDVYLIMEWYDRNERINDAIQRFRLRCLDAAAGNTFAGGGRDRGRGGGTCA